MKISNLELQSYRDTHDSMRWRFELAKPVGDMNTLAIELYYSKGGVNYYDGSRRKRGYYVSCRLMNVSGMVESYELFGERAGGCVFIEEASRFSRKRMEALEDTAQAAIEPHALELLELSPAFN